MGICAELRGTWQGRARCYTRVPEGPYEKELRKSLEQCESEMGMVMLYRLEKEQSSKL